MSKVQKEVKVITGKYVNAEGREKNRYRKIGSIIETKNGPMLKLDAIPLVDGGWNGWAYLNDPEDEQAPQRQAPASFSDDDDIPGF